MKKKKRRADVDGVVPDGGRGTSPSTVNRVCASRTFLYANRRGQRRETPEPRGTWVKDAHVDGREQKLRRAKISANAQKNHECAARASLIERYREEMI